MKNSKNDLKQALNSIQTFSRVTEDVDVKNTKNFTPYTQADVSEHVKMLNTVNFNSVLKAKN